MINISQLSNNKSISSTMLSPFFIVAIEAGHFRLDGGAMFGVVPKLLWQKKIKPDINNCIPMTMRCLFIHSLKTQKNYLIDCGIGHKLSRVEKICSIDFQHGSLLSSLARINIYPKDISDVILTHLHFDHCGGCTYYQPDGNLRLTFYNATHYVSKNHWETAKYPNEREKVSFLAENLEPLKSSGKLQEIYIGHTFEPGLSVLMVNGHTDGQLLPLIQVGGKTILFCADLFPSKYHIHLAWIMGYDMNASETIKEKKSILYQAASQKMVSIFRA